MALGVTSTIWIVGTVSPLTTSVRGMAFPLGSVMLMIVEGVNVIESTSPLNWT